MSREAVVEKPEQNGHGGVGCCLLEEIRMSA